MRRVVAMVAGLAMFLGGGAVSTQTPAELVPAKTLAYVELQQPAALAKELAALLEGSYLADVPDSLAPLYAKMGEPRPRPRGPDALGLVGVALAPEMFKEFARLKGAALAVTGIDKEEGMPEFLAIVQPGESNLPGLIMRMFIASYSSGGSSFDGKNKRQVRMAIERVSDVEGVGLFRQVDRRWENSAEPKLRAT